MSLIVIDNNCYYFFVIYNHIYNTNTNRHTQKNENIITLQLEFIYCIFFTYI